MFNLIAPPSTLKPDYSEKILGIASAYLCYLAETEATIQESPSPEGLYQD